MYDAEKVCGKIREIPKRSGNGKLFQHNKQRSKT